MTYFQFPLSLVYTIKNLHDIYHGINRDLRFKGGHRPRRKVNFVQFFAKEEILNVIVVETLIINGEKNVIFHDLGISLHGKTDIPHESWGIYFNFEL